MRVARFAAFASALLFLVLAGAASAAVRPVVIANFAFSPPSVTITAGDTVTWTNKDAAAHSAVVNGVGQTRVLLQNQSGSLMFNAAGNFPYICGVHGSSMTGTVIVRAAATQPPPPPTPVPTPVPTAVRTPVPTPPPTVAPTESPSPSPTATVAATSAAPTATATPSVAAAAPTAAAPAPAASIDGGSGAPILVGAALLAALAVVAYAVARLRR